MPRVLVILPTESYRAADFVAAADSLGVELAIASEEVPLLGLEDRFVKLDCSDVEGSARAIADLATVTPIDAIVAADDAGVITAARAGELIGLPHNPAPAAAATRDKGRMRRLLDLAEIPQPPFREITEPEEGVKSASELGFPVVVKPVGLSASRGVIRADDHDEVRQAIDRILTSFSDEMEPTGGRMLIERFVPGPEVSLEGLIWDGRLERLAVFDKPDPLDGPFFQETMFVTPSRLPEDVLNEIDRVTQRAITALGLEHGPVHAELRLHDSQPIVVEVAARTIGGLCGRSLTFGLLGSSLEEMVLRQALGIRRRGMGLIPRATGALMLPIPRPGILTGVSGVDAARELPGVWSVEITVPIGAEVVPPPDGDRYLGFVFATGPTRDDVIQSLRSAAETIILELDGRRLRPRS